MIDIKGKINYTAFGLTISSEVSFPELMPIQKVGDDVDILFGRVPKEISHPIIKNKNCQVSENQLLFYAVGVGHYFVENGNRIIVQPDEYADMGNVRLFILGTAFGALLLQRGVLPIHGSSIIVNGLCTIFTGASGVGKSTLSSAFQKSGFSFLADDLSVITFDDGGKPLVQPGYPQQKLCRDSIEIYGENTCHLRLIDPDTDKYALPAHKHFMSSPVRLAAIFELIPQDCLKVEARMISGVEKLKVLMRNIYRVELLQLLGLKTEFLKLCLNIVKDATFYYLTRPMDSFLLEEQMSLVKEYTRSEIRYDTAE